MKQFTIATAEGASTNQSLWDLAQFDHSRYIDALDIDRASNLTIGDSFGGLTYTIWRTADIE